MNKNFFAGIEEVFSRLISFIITVVFFLIYVSAKDSGQVLLNWSGTLTILLIFWVVYEFVAYFLYFIFVYFSKQNQINEKPAKPNAANGPDITSDSNLPEDL